MIEHGDEHELPELSDEDVELLYAICKSASSSDSPPFKALFAAYDEVFSEQQIEPEHDGVVFRYLMRVGESTRIANSEHRPVNLVQQLRSVLEAHGVTFVEPSEASVEDEVAEPIFQPTTVLKSKLLASPKRRLSFDDAHLEETWLSERSERLGRAHPSAQSGLLGLSPRRSRNVTTARRARSTSSQRNPPIGNAGLYHPYYPYNEPISAPRDHLDPTLLFDPSRTQLEQNADAFLEISAIRAARQGLHTLHRAAMQRQEARTYASSIAIAHDRRTLLRQAIDQWRQTLDIKQHERERRGHLKRLEEKATRSRNLFLLTKAFTHWATSCQYERLRTKIAQRYMLKVTYFKKWRAIACENQTKMRRILGRKYLTIWRAKTARTLLWQEQAIAHYEETLMKKCKTLWFWQFCSERVQGWHEQWIEKRALSRLSRCIGGRREREQYAESIHRTNLARRTLRCLCDRSQKQQLASESAAGHIDRTIVAKHLDIFRVEARLAPIARALKLRINVGLERKALKVWRLHCSLNRQADEIGRKRILQTAWTNWNDALRCNALAQRIDERVLVETLYRWVLQERLKLYKRTIDGRLISRVFGRWLSKVEQDRDRLAEAEVIFAERQRRCRLAVAMQLINLNMRNREDAERAGLEFKNSRILPQVLEVWKEKTDEVKQFVKWAADARFYYLCTSTIRTWQAKTTEHKHNRRRALYAQVRARIKIRLVGSCLSRWRAEATHLQSMREEAERRAQGRLAEIGAKTFHRWAEKAIQHVELNYHAADMDSRKLLGSAFLAMTAKRSDLVRMHQQAHDFRRDVDLELLAGALRRFQWATFTAVRKVESAEALLARNRDQHIKQMLRHWAGQIAAKKAGPKGEDEGVVEDEPESPSIQPASRVASRPAIPSSPLLRDAVSATPGYLRTPSRTRRAGRFRALPTPMPITPMAFDSAYLATTPAPLLNTQQTQADHSFAGLTPQVTPFERKLRAGGIIPVPPSATKSLRLKRSVNLPGGGTGKSVRFAGSNRFRNRVDDDHEKNS